MSYRRKQEDNRRLKQKYKIAGTHYRAGIYFNTDKNRFMRYYFSPAIKKFFKRQAAKKVRKYRHHLHGNEYRKVDAYWWHVY